VPVTNRQDPPGLNLFRCPGGTILGRQMMPDDLEDL
jgi:hypothetical protein